MESLRTVYFAACAGLALHAASPVVAQGVAGIVEQTRMCDAAGSAVERLAACETALQMEAKAAAERRAGLLAAQAKAKLMTDDRQGAAAALTEAIVLAPNFGAAFAARADLLRDNDQCDLALADYHQAVKLMPENLQVYIGRSRCLIDADELEGALSDLDLVIARDARNEQGLSAQALAAKTRILVEIGQLDAALDTSAALIALPPRSAAAFLERGTIWRRKGDIAKALSDYDEALKIASDGPPEAMVLVRIERGMLFSEAKDTQAASKEFDLAVAADASGVAGLMARAEFYQRAAKFAEAIADYDAALQKSPEEISARANRGLTQYYKGDYEKAAADLKIATEQLGTPQLVLLAYAMSARSGSKEAAGELAKQAAKFKAPDWPTPLFDLFLARKMQQAVEAAATKPQERCEAQFYIGQFNIIRNNKAAAEKALKTAVGTCAKDDVELRGATEDLKRLK